MNQIEVDKIGSATSPLNLSRTLSVVDANGAARAGDVVVVRVLTDNATYNMLELPTGRLAKVNPGDVVAGVTVAAYAIPVSLAYAGLAGLPPPVGVYGYLLGGLGYALLGSSRQLAIGPTSAIS